MTMKKRSTVMGGIKEYLEQCPAIATYVEALGREVNVNYLDEPEKSYSISQEPNEPWVKKYVDGTGIKLITVTFSSREAYGPAVIENLQVCGFYEELEEWIAENNRERNYPNIGEKKKAMGIALATTPYLFDTSRTKAKYQVTIQIKYYQEV